MSPQQGSGACAHVQVGAVDLLVCPGDAGVSLRVTPVSVLTGPGGQEQPPR